MIKFNKKFRIILGSILIALGLISAVFIHYFQPAMTHLTGELLSRGYFVLGIIVGALMFIK